MRSFDTFFVNGSGGCWTNSWVIGDLKRHDNYVTSLQKVFKTYISSQQVEREGICLNFWCCPLVAEELYTSGTSGSDSVVIGIGELFGGGVVDMEGPNDAHGRWLNITGM